MGKARPSRDVYLADVPQVRHPLVERLMVHQMEKGERKMMREECVRLPFVSGCPVSQVTTGFLK